MDDEDCDFEHSPLSGSFTRDGVEVDVEIYRRFGTLDPWRLEVVHISGGATRWQKTFATDGEAYKAFAEMVEAGGIASFASRAPKIRH
jgi:hypothetical protein